MGVADKTGYFSAVVQWLSHVWLFCDPMDCSTPGSSVYGISQARILEWVAISFSRGSSWSGDRTHMSFISYIAGSFFTTSHLFTTESPRKPLMSMLLKPYYVHKQRPVRQRPMNNSNKAIYFVGGTIWW